MLNIDAVPVCIQLKAVLYPLNLWRNVGLIFFYRLKVNCDTFLMVQDYLSIKIQYIAATGNASSNDFCYFVNIYKSTSKCFALTIVLGLFSRN